MLLFSCSKSIVSHDPAILYLNDCNEYENESELVSLCFENVVSDSRCPTGVVCVWEGTAVANFTFKKDNTSYPITLSTLKMPPQYTKDTIVAGYKIEFLNLHPYPRQHSTPSAGTIKDEVKVTRL